MSIAMIENESPQKGYVLEWNNNDIALNKYTYEVNRGSKILKVENIAVFQEIQLLKETFSDESDAAIKLVKNYTGEEDVFIRRNVIPLFV